MFVVNRLPRDHTRRGPAREDRHRGPLAARSREDGGRRRDREVSVAGTFGDPHARRRRPRHPGLRRSATCRSATSRRGTSSSTSEAHGRPPRRARAEGQEHLRAARPGGSISAAPRTCAWTRRSPRRASTCATSSTCSGSTRIRASREIEGTLETNARLHLALGGPEDVCKGGYLDVAGVGERAQAESPRREVRRGPRRLRVPLGRSEGRPRRRGDRRALALAHEGEEGGPRAARLGARLGRGPSRRRAARQHGGPGLPARPRRSARRRARRRSKARPPASRASAARSRRSTSTPTSTSRRCASSARRSAARTSTSA